MTTTTQARTRTRWIAAAGAAALAFSLAACSSGSDAGSSDAGSDQSMVGDDPATWAPLEITMDMNGQTIEMVPNQRAIFTDLPPDDAENNIVVESLNPEAVESVQREGGEGDMSNPGLIAVSPGDSQILVLNGFPADGPSEEVMQLNVTVTEE